jgi:hypothetical protein
MHIPKGLKMKADLASVANGDMPGMTERRQIITELRQDMIER